MIDDQSRPLPRIPRTEPSPLIARTDASSRTVRRISEDDLCPVCHQELPSSTLPNSGALRATHISICIENQLALHSASSRSGTQTSVSQPVVPRRQASNASQTSRSSRIETPSAGSSSFAPGQIIPNTPEGRMAAREQAHAAVVFGASQITLQAKGRRTGVFPYQATEKDCIDDAECTICMEEYEVGVDMGRLECFCRFHLTCIRKWFESHPGRCPVHQHDGYGY